jgi:hypothetical protein
MSAVVFNRGQKNIFSNLNIYISLTLYPEGVEAEASQILLQDTHVLPKKII